LINFFIRLLLSIILIFPRLLQGEQSPVFIGIVVKNHDRLIPFFLKSIDHLDYDKKLIQVQFDVCNESEEVRRVLNEWSLKNNPSYRSISSIHHPISSHKTQEEKNKLFAEIKDRYLTKTKESESSYCFILASDVFLFPRTLKHLIEQDKPIIAPLLRPIPEVGDRFRNFFADVTENGYYKHHLDYDSIANRQKLGTFQVPCVHSAYLIKSDLCEKLSFTKNFLDWEFVAFSKNARENLINQYLCNEREFGTFLHFYKEMSDEEEKAFTLVEPELEVTPDLLHKLLSSYYPNDPALKDYANKFNYQDYAIYRVQNRDLYYLDDVNDFIKDFILKQGFSWEEFIHEQFKKYAKPGSVVLDIGGHIGTHTLNLSRLVGENGKVHVFEPQAKMFCELALNMHLNYCQNVIMHHNALGSSEQWVEVFVPKETWTQQISQTLINEGHGTVTESMEHSMGDRAQMICLDSLHLDDISLIKIDVEGFEMEVIRGGLETIRRNHPVMIVEIFQNEELDGKIKEIEDLGYIHLPLDVDNFLFIPTMMLQEKRHPPIDVAWEGSFLDVSSLSNVNRSIVKELAKNPSVTLSCVNTTTSFLSDSINAPLELLTHAPENIKVTIRHSWPPNWIPPATGKWILMQPWEYGALPADWPEKIKNVDEVWVPTHFVKDQFIDSGIPGKKIKVVPNGYDPSIFHPEVKPMKLPTDKKFKFLFVGGTIHRKGPDLLLSSYLKSFTAKDDVCLIIKDFGTNEHYLGLTHRDLIKAAQNTPGGAEIVYLENDMSPEELASLYKACDCLVHPYRGEGFALPVLEAMACGLPVIVTAGGATSDFVTNECGWFIPATKKSFGMQLGQMQLVKEGWLLEPNTDVLSALLSWLPKHSLEAQVKGINASRQAKNWTWEKAALVAAKRLNEYQR